MPGSKIRLVGISQNIEKFNTPAVLFNEIHTLTILFLNSKAWVKHLAEQLSNILATCLCPTHPVIKNYSWKLLILGNWFPKESDVLGSLEWMACQHYDCKHLHQRLLTVTHRFLSLSNKESVIESTAIPVHTFGTKGDHKTFSIIGPLAESEMGEWLR